MRAAGVGGPANFSACQDVLRRLDKTFKAFFRRPRDLLPRIGAVRTREACRFNGPVRECTVKHDGVR